MSAFAFPLVVTLQADSQEEADELRDEAVAAIAQGERLHPSVLSVTALRPRRVEDRRVTA